MELRGYQVHEEWMGTTYLTLADLWPRHPRAVIVGLNPAPSSVEAGHYYQGRAGQRQLRRLAASGLFTLAPGERHFETAALVARVGFTDLVKRPTIGEGGVSAAEISHGRALLVSKLAEQRVPLVVCVFRHAVSALLGSAGRPGIQPGATSWGGTVFRMPGPFDRADTVDAVMGELRTFLAESAWNQIAESTPSLKRSASTAEGKRSAPP